MSKLARRQQGRDLLVDDAQGKIYVVLSILISVTSFHRGEKRVNQALNHYWHCPFPCLE